MLTFIITNTFLNIIAATQYNHLVNDTLADTNAAVSVIVLRKYFVCGVNCGAAELNISHFAKFETDIQTGAPNIFSLFKYYSV